MPARFCGRISYRASFPATRLRGLDIGNARTRWRGRDRHIVMSYVNAARDEVQFTTSQPDAAADLARESWSAAGDPTAMRQAFLSFHSDVQAVLSAAPQVHAWPIYERAPLSTWSRGCVVLLGDACHPATPDLVSGAALALEDAVVLARCLDEFHDIGVEAALRTYEATRKPRTSLVQASSAGAQMRNQSSPDWLYGYDAWRVPLRATMDNF
jgi:salicylate hydroxylase/6-hydroxynicotinate 3-monooxygenase